MLLNVYKQLELRSERGEGVWLVDGKGRRYLDFYGGHAVALLGYAHPALVSALGRQARELFFQSNAVQLGIRERAAASLVGFAPVGLTHAFFVNSGAEANENALRVAFMRTGRTRVVAVEGGFHGRTAAAAAASSSNSTWYGFPGAPFEVSFVPFDDLEALDKAVGADVAAVILEPIQGLQGARPLSREFISSARELTAERGALLVFDEVQCGMGRTGYPFAAQAYGVTPDILTTAKGLAGGFPAGAMLLSADVASGMRQGSLGTTFGGGPLACALIEEVIGIVRSDGLLENVRRLSGRLRSGCRGAGPVIEVQGMGFLLGLRLGRPASEVLKALLDRGIIAGESRDPRVIRLLPPLILEDSHVDQLLETLREIPA